MGTKRALHRVAALAVTGLVVSVGAVSCTSTEFIQEPPGLPTDRASGAVPAGAIGVCKREGTKRPPVVSEKLWEHAKPCTTKTPEKYIRLGYSDKDDPGVEAQNEQILAALREGPKEDGGNNQFVAMLRGVRQRSLDIPSLRYRVSRDTTSAGACDFTYMLNTMGKSREKIERDACTAEVYDSEERKEVCLFDKPEGLWLTSGWACLMNVRALGSDQSCHRLCAYDDYCARQVSCAGADVDLLLCAMGVCLPEQTGLY
ncbi:hypothetical protein [Polyangium sorediatum]|uniref:Lipoprotein n=1 Tax=Polyangium sorediatum TaxID=889274 RepID=A0ABT6P3S4_9BACT|nr:hypothetical protein [Polyangium sorediatum]MDI1435181.1 hypothetical protein [Polyangium sorediatum]